MPSHRRSTPVSDSEGTTRSAWKLFLRLSPGSTVLCLGNNFDILARNIARHVRITYVLSPDLAGLRSARRPVKSRRHDHEILFVGGQHLPFLPFADRSFDCIVGSGILESVAEDEATWNPDKKTSKNVWRMMASQFGETSPTYVQRSFLIEIRRILKPDGQIFLITGNRTSYEHFTGLNDPLNGPKVTPILPRTLANLHSIAARARPYRNYLHTAAAYRRLFRAAGFSRVEMLKLLPSPQRLAEIRPAGSAAKGWRPGDPGGWRARIKEHARLVPGYGLIAETGGNPSPSLLDRVLRSVAANLGLPEDADIEIEKFEVRNTEKLVLRAIIGPHPVIIRLPLSDATARGLRRNWRFLNFLSSQRDMQTPRPVDSGEIDQIPYFAEQRLIGALLLDSPREIDRSRLLRDTEMALNALNPALETRRHVALAGSDYRSLVQRPLDLILATIGDDELGRKARDTVRAWLFGLRFRRGVSHGDFNIANLLLLESGSIGVFDWEAARIRGLPAVDAVNYLDGMYRHVTPGATMVDTIRLLLDDAWPDEAERAYLLRQAARSGVASRSIPALAVLFWLHRIEAQLMLADENHASTIEKRIIPVLRELVARPAAAP